ncbi:hypothetical protein NEAUS05_2770, partial [Nematocida ausubeli]
TQHVQEISNEDFLKIIKQTEKQKTTFVYRSRTSIMDDLD